MNRLKEKLKVKLLEIEPFFRKAVKHKSVFAQLMEILIHKALINTSPIDYYRFGFFHSDKSFRQRSYYVGKRGSRYFPFDRNEIRYVAIFDNKYIFKTMAKGYGLPQPETICITGPRFGNVSTKEELGTIISDVEGGFVIKPIEGSGGRGVFICSKLGNSIYIDKVQGTLEDLWHLVKSNDYLVEYRIEQIEQLDAIYSESVNTLRIATYQTEDRKIFILLRFIKFGTDGRLVDNAGLGGIIGFVDEYGKIIYCYNYTKHIFNIERHPDTNCIINGIKLEGFQEAASLAQKAAQMFNFVGTVGWDIALTDEGPVLLEGNIFYDCWVVQIEECGSILNEKVVRYLMKYHMFTRFDKTRIYPHFNRKRIIA